MNTLFMDARYALRILVRKPSFAIFAVFAMALGIGAATAVFSVVDAVLIRPLPYAESDRLVTVWQSEPDAHWAPATIQDFLAFRQQNNVFTDLTAWEVVALTLQKITEPQSVLTGRVSPEMFRMLGIPALLGRGLQPGDDNLKSEPVAVISERLWKARFGTDRDLVGKHITLSRKIYTIVGIMPAAFQSPRKQVDVWIPLIPQVELAKSATTHYLRIIGRLKEGVTVDRARIEMDMIAKRLSMQFPATNAGVGIRIMPLLENLQEEIGPMLKILFSAVGLLLVITCVNLSGLLLARTVNRRQEISLRLAIGASRRRLIRQLLVEGSILALIGGACGLFLTPWLLRSLLLLVPERIAAYVPNLENATVNGRVLTFSVVVSAATGILLGLVPAWRSSRPHIHENLKSDSFTSPGGHQQSHSQRFLVIVEFALSLVLLIAAGLLLRSFVLLEQRPLGFRPDHVLAFSVSLPEASYSTDRDVRTFYDRLLREMRTIPGVELAAAVSNLPLGGTNSDTDILIGGQLRPPPGQEVLTQYSTVTPGYFRTMGIPLLEGRDFDERDSERHPKVAIVSESTARRFWPAGGAVGKRIQLGGEDEWFRIVGVVKDVRWHEFDNEVVTALYTYLPCDQHPNVKLNVVLQTSVDPLEIATAVRAGGRPDRSGPIDLPIEHHGRHRALGECTTPFQHDADRSVRSDCSDPDRRWNPWNRFSVDRQPKAGIRHSACAWRQPERYPSAGPR